MAFSGGPDGGTILSLPPVYYGTVDATPLWVCLLHDAWRWGLPDREVEALLDPMEGCLRWLADFGCDSGPFVSYVDKSGRGLTNQGWKDSHDSIQFRDGRIAVAPLALCEVQGYAYEAAAGGADLLDAFGRPGAARWREFAANLSERFRERFWVSDDKGPYPSVALDAQGDPVDSLSSNIGHLLGTGLLDETEAELVARRLGDADLNSGFGLRTLAASSAGFNPLGYHTGSVWAHDTAIAITGLTRTPGLAARQAACALIEGLLCAAKGFAFRVPEPLWGSRQSRAAKPACLPSRLPSPSLGSSVCCGGAFLPCRRSPRRPGRECAVRPVARLRLAGGRGARHSGNELRRAAQRFRRIRRLGPAPGDDCRELSDGSPPVSRSGSDSRLVGRGNVARRN